MCQLCTFGKQGKASQDKVKSQPASILPRGGWVGAPLHPPVEHVAQGLVPDPRVHRGAGLPGNQVGSIVEKVDVHQVEGTAGSQTGSSGCRLELLGPLGRPPAIPPSSPGRCGQAARGKSSSEVDSEETHWAHALEPSHRKDPRTKVATSSRGTHRGYLELASKQRSQKRVRSGEKLGVRPGLSSPRSWPCNLKPPWGPRGALGGSVHAAEAAPSSQPLESLGETLRPCILWACRGMGRLGGRSPLGALERRWGLSGSQQSRRVGSTPPVELGPPGPETQPDSTPRAPPPARAHGGSSSSPLRPHGNH